MPFSHLLAIPLLLANICHCGKNEPKPQWPQGYIYEYHFASLINNFQETGRIYYSGHQSKLRQDLYYDTKNANYLYISLDNPKLVIHKYYPRLQNKRHVTSCIIANEEKTPFAGERMLPDFKYYKYEGEASIRGRRAHKWQGFYKDGGRDILYTEYSKKQQPIPLFRERIKFKKGGIPLEHIWQEYFNYIPKEPKSSTFKLPHDIKCIPLGSKPNNNTSSKTSRHKKYKSSEHSMRISLFKKRKRMIDEHNRKGLPYTLEANQFAYMTNEEIEGYMGCAPLPENGFEHKHLQVRKFRKTTKLPASFDWREKGGVTPVSHQLRCGSCWAFAAVAALEGCYFQHTNRRELLDLSEQFLVNCVVPAGFKAGCYGLHVNTALDFIKKIGGVQLISEAGPYLSTEGYCEYKPKTLFAKPKGFIKINKSTEDFKRALVTHGPIAATFWSYDDFKFYKKGIYVTKGKPSKQTHAMTIVGYGSDDEDGPYWIVKNSWGTSWGEDGYAMISAKENTMGILDHGFQPVF